MWKKHCREKSKERLCWVIWDVKKAAWAYGLHWRGEGGAER
jgi:hypothetical protein